MKNPWLGLQSYTEESLKEYQFNGRRIASASLAALIRQNLFVTLYGRSGVGKTSLLQAGVFPMLRREGFYPVSIRLNNIEDGKDTTPRKDNEGKPGEGEAAKVIWDKVSAALQKQGFSYKPCDKKDEYEPDFSDILVFRKLFSAGRFLNENGEEEVPVLVLDQFEELLYKAPESASLLISQLYALIDDNYNLRISHPEWHDDTNFRIGVSIREDDLYLFEDYIDTLNCVDFKSNRYRLMPLSENEAMDVVLKPIEGKQIFEQGKEEEIAKEIIRLSKNNGQKVNTLLLSLLCRVLYDNCVKPDKCIALSDLKNYKDVLEAYYLEVVKDLPKDERYYIEDHLIDDQGRRTFVYIEDIKKFAPKALPLIKKSQDSESSKEQRNSDDTPKSNASKILFNESQGRVEIIHDQLAASMQVFRNRRANERRSRFVAISLMSYFIIAGYLIWHFLSNILLLSWNIAPEEKLMQYLSGIIEGFSFKINEAYIQSLMGAQIVSYIVLICLLGFVIPKMICRYFYGNVKIGKLIVLILAVTVSGVMASEWLLRYSLSDQTINSCLTPIIGYVIVSISLLVVNVFHKKRNNNETK